MVLHRSIRGRSFSPRGFANYLSTIPTLASKTIPVPAPRMIHLALNAASVLAPAVIGHPWSNRIPSTLEIVAFDQRASLIRKTSSIRRINLKPAGNDSLNQLSVHGLRICAAKFRTQPAQLGNYSRFGDSISAFDLASKLLEHWERQSETVVSILSGSSRIQRRDTAKS
jgi:hypothetical protein